MNLPEMRSLLTATPAADRGVVMSVKAGLATVATARGLQTYPVGGEGVKPGDKVTIINGRIIRLKDGITYYI